MEDMLQRLIGEGIELVLTLGASPSLVKVDPGQLDQVIRKRSLIFSSRSLRQKLRKKEPA